jgi:hypothetical protein
MAAVEMAVWARRRRLAQAPLTRSHLGSATNFKAFCSGIVREMRRGCARNKRALIKAAGFWADRSRGRSLAAAALALRRVARWARRAWRTRPRALVRWGALDLAHWLAAWAARRMALGIRLMEIVLETL